MSCGDVFLGVIAIFFPPIAVWIKSGLCSADSLINILLCMLGYIPGLLHAWYIIAKYPEPDHDFEPLDAEAARGQRVTYYYVNHETAAPRRQQHLDQRMYGTQQQSSSTNKTVSSSQWQGSVGQPHQQGGSAGGAGSSRQPQQPQQPVVAGSSEGGAPPSYSDVIKGDNKIQSRD